jgi:PAS domain S-box-containing protein
MNPASNQATAADLRRRAEKALQAQPSKRAGKDSSGAELQRLVHELQVHQIELELQNAELQEARNRSEILLEKYTDLYDFAPVGYFSLDAAGLILEVNLTGAALLGVERSRLLQRRLQLFVAPSSRVIFTDFLANVFNRPGKQICEASLINEEGVVFWSDLQAVPALAPTSSTKTCRVAISDITALKRAEAAQLQLDALTLSNHELKKEVTQRQAAEVSLKRSEQLQRHLLAESRLMQEQLRRLSHQVLQAQEEERKRISRELHDVIAQTLTGINIQLMALKQEASGNIQGLARNIARTQRLVEKSVNLVHQFARELRPAVLDDLGLIPALHSFVKQFSERTHIHVHLKAFARVEELDINRRTILFRVAQEALTNVSRHAQAGRVEIHIQKLPDAIAMVITDNGKSFRVDRAFNSRATKHLGLLGMRERLEMVGGQFAVTSVAGEGTTITATLPFGKTGGGGGNL